MHSLPPDNFDLIVFLQLLTVMGILGIIAVGVAIFRAVTSKKDNTVDDPTGEKKQKIFDTLNKVIEDVKQTV